MQAESYNQEETTILRSLSRLLLALNLGGGIKRLGNYSQTDIAKDLERIDNITEKSFIFVQFFYIDDIYCERITQRDSQTDAHYQSFLNFFHTLGQDVLKIAQDPLLNRIYKM